MTVDMDQFSSHPRPPELPDSQSIHNHAFDPEQAIPTTPGWHSWEATPSRRPGILLGRGWDQMVGLVDGDVTQTWAWIQYAIDTGYQSAILLAKIAADGSARAVAVGYVSESRWALLGLRAIRFPAFPCATRNLDLVAEAVHVCERVARARHCMSIEFLSGGQPKELALLPLSGYGIQEKLEYVIDLSRGRDRLWEGLHKDQRRNVRYSERMNVKVHQLDSLEAVRKLREIQLEVTERHAVKGEIYGIRSPEAYDALHRVLVTQGLARLYCGILDGQIVMAALCSSYGTRARLIYSGASERGLRVRASTAVIWHIITELSEEGFDAFSLGIAEPTAEIPSSLAHGLHEFKLHIGAELRHVPFASRQLNVPRAMAHRALRRAASLARKVHHLC